MSEEGNDFLSLMKKKQKEEGKPSVIGTALEKAEKAEETAKKLIDENKVLKYINEELKGKNAELEKERDNLKERLEKMIELMTKSEKAMAEALEEKKQLEDDFHKFKLKSEFEIKDLTTENVDLKKQISALERIVEMEVLKQPESDSQE